MDRSELVARTRSVDANTAADIDLVAIAGDDGLLFQRDGVGFAARGCALQVARRDIGDVLAAIAIDDEVRRPGSGPVAFGALPFLPDQPATLMIPEVVVGRGEDGSCWITDVGSGPFPEHPTLPSAPMRATRSPSSFEVRSARPPGEWCDAVSTATQRIRRGDLDKVVLARELVLVADQPIPTADVLVRLRQQYPGCFVFSIDGLVGATPELLVSRHDDIVRAQPMAGTAPRRGDPQADAAVAAALLASPVYRHEHEVTIDMVHDTLLAFCSYLDDEAEPSVVALANVQHLATTVEGRLSHPPASVLELVAALHPTPAVCGRPRAAALALIAEVEGLVRGRYAGTVGWVDAAGNGQWAVSIRCAQIDGRFAHLYGGNGIVAESEPTAELAETRDKLQAMLMAIVRP
ncbi:MAG: isochorismate synthase [Actinomycetota bacterium]|nr:isochorismate synthase [Actinomycetota bacterium]